MAFKEGVSIEDVQKFRQFVATVKNLDVDVDAGLVTPDEAFHKVAEAVNPKKSKTEPQK